ncbi:hypothetical protein VUN82_03965 [Micrococcaceae bacterium Sec5.1]
MSMQFPESTAPSTTEAGALEAKRSRNGRTGVGLCLIFIGLAWVLLLWRTYGGASSEIAALNETERTELMMADAQNIILTAFLLAVGIWNVATRRSNSKTPLVAALVLVGLELVLDVVSVVDTVTTTGEMPNVVSLIFRVAILAQTIRLLRFKPVNPLLLQLP